MPTPGSPRFLDYKGQTGHPDLMGFGRENNFLFWLKSGEPSPSAVHFAFVAKCRAIVDAFYLHAMAMPGPRIASRLSVSRAEYHAATTQPMVTGPRRLQRVEVVIKTPEIGGRNEPRVALKTGQPLSLVIDVTEHPQRTQRVPPTWFTRGFAERDGERFRRCRRIEQPSTIGLRPALDDVHGIPDAHVGLNTGVLK